MELTFPVIVLIVNYKVIEVRYYFIRSYSILLPQTEKNYTEHSNFTNFGIDQYGSDRINEVVISLYAGLSNNFSQFDLGLY